MKSLSLPGDTPHAGAHRQHPRPGRQGRAVRRVPAHGLASDQASTARGGDEQLHPEAAPGCTWASSRAWGAPAAQETWDDSRPSKCPRHPPMATGFFHGTSPLRRPQAGRSGEPSEPGTAVRQQADTAFHAKQFAAMRPALRRGGTRRPVRARRTPTTQKPAVARWRATRTVRSSALGTVADKGVHVLAAPPAPGLRPRLALRADARWVPLVGRVKANLVATMAPAPRGLFSLFLEDQEDREGELEGPRAGLGRHPTRDARRRARVDELLRKVRQVKSARTTSTQAPSSTTAKVPTSARPWAAAQEAWSSTRRTAWRA